MKNIGSLDQVIRLLAIAAILAVLGLGLVGGLPSLLLGGVALVLLLTSLTSTCPAYMPFGFSTLPKRR